MITIRRFHKCFIPVGLRHTTRGTLSESAPSSPHRGR
jgi:hypothetical protein